MYIFTNELKSRHEYSEESMNLKFNSTIHKKQKTQAKE